MCKTEKVYKNNLHTNFSVRNIQNTFWRLIHIENFIEVSKCKTKPVSIIFQKNVSVINKSSTLSIVIHLIIMTIIIIIVQIKSIESLVIFKHYRQSSLFQKIIYCQIKLTFITINILKTNLITINSRGPSLTPDFKILTYSHY